MKAFNCDPLHTSGCVWVCIDLSSGKMSPEIHRNHDFSIRAAWCLIFKLLEILVKLFISSWNLVNVFNLGLWISMQSFDTCVCFGKAVQQLWLLCWGQIDPASILKLLEILVKLFISSWTVVNVFHLVLWINMQSFKTYMWPWTTKPVIRVNFSKLRFMHHLKAE